MKLFVVFLVLFNLQFIIAQDTIVSYFDQNDKSCSSSDYFLKQLVFKNSDDTWELEKYYNTEYKAYKGSYTDKSLATPIGMHFYYYENGFIEKELNYNDKGQFDGKSLYYLSSNKRDRLETYSHGIKDGKWIWYYSEGNIAWYEFYRDEQLIVTQKFNKEGKELLYGISEMIAPKWNYSDESLNEYVLNRVKKQKRFKKGESFLLFVTTFGKVVDVQNMNGKRTKKANEIYRILFAGPEWNSGLDHLRPVDGILLYEIKK